MMYPCLEIRFIVFCVGIKYLLFLCRDISFVIRTHEISLDKNNSPGSPDKDTPLSGSCYKVSGGYPKRHS